MTSGAVAALTAVAAWYQAQGLPLPDRDARLDDAAAIASQRAAEGAHTEDDLRFALRRAGVVDADVMTIRSGASRRRILAELDRQPASAAAMTHWGGGGDDATVILARRMVALDRPPPLRTDEEHLELQGRSARGWSLPQVVFSGPDGVVADAPVRRVGGDGFLARVPLHRGVGRYRIELLVEGPTVAVLFSVWHRQQAPAVPEVRVPPPALSLAAGLGDVRRQAGAKPLRRLDALDAVALAHSADMARRGYFSHRSPEGLGPPARVKRGGLAVRRILENIATAASPARAHMQVLDSPGHLRNVIDPGVTHYGIGIFERAGTSYVTWLLAEMGPRTSTGGHRARRSGPAPPTP